LPQKAKSAGFAKPHRGQEGVSEVPHLPQKLMPSGFSNPQLAQRIGLSLLFWPLLWQEKVLWVKAGILPLLCSGALQDMDGAEREELFG
jgi:hypothetical protein